jgi:hypothetical protein
MLCVHMCGQPSGVKMPKKEASKAKRDAARSLNQLFGEEARAREERAKARQRKILGEMKHGKQGRPLEPLAVLQRAHVLLELGVPLSTLAAHGTRLPPRRLTEADLAIIARVQELYGFRPEVWSLVGVAFESGAPRAERVRGGQGRRG